MTYQLTCHILNLADKASRDSGTSYEDYIRLFTSKVDRAFNRSGQRNAAIGIAVQYGYVPKRERKFESSYSVYKRDTISI